MKKVNALAIAILALALTACGAKKEEAPVSGLNAQGDSPEVTVSAYVGGQPVRAFFKKGIVCHVFNASISCVRVN